MRKTDITARLFPCIAILAFLIVAGCATTPVPVDTRPYVTVYSFPYWIEYPVESSDYERIWKVVLDVASENWTIDVMDKESGYLQTTRIAYFENFQDNVYTIKIFPEKRIVKIGVTMFYRNSTSQLNLPTRILTDQGHIYDVGHEIQDRLRVIK